MTAIRYIAAALLAVTLALLLLAQAAHAQVRVIDGDSLKIDGHAFRLHGVDAPELRQTCGGWLVGAYAAAVLRALLERHHVLCIPMDTDRYGRTIATCYRDDGLDIGGEMVRQGLALAYVRYSAKYAPLEAIARAARLGVHAQPCMPPWEYRRR